MTCTECGKETGIAREVAGKTICMGCNPFRRCPKCAGLLESRPSPNWMNRFTCKDCKKNYSR